MEGCLCNLVFDKLVGSFDYIIVGGGTAGCVVASRLSQDSQMKVLLLEAGGWDKKWEIHTPGEASYLRDTDIDWKYLVVGGCSSMDNMNYARGNEADYNSWASLGAEGWSWDEVLPFFLVSENNKRPDFIRSPLHSRDGPLTVSDNTFMTPLANTFINAATELGHHKCDITSGINIGVGIPQATIANGRRCSTATAFLKPSLHRSNLTVITNALVHKVEIHNGRAIGVHVTVKKEIKKILALREVILSAGTIGSPKLLMLSGIGPNSHLKDMNIPCKCDLPVGQNLQDHITIPMKATIEEENGVITTEAKESMSTLLQYILTRKGILSSNDLEGAVLTRTCANPLCEWPDIQINFIPTFYHLGKEEPALTRLSSARYDRLMTYTSWEVIRMKQEGVSFLVILLHPRRGGEVTLKSKDPVDPPDINPHYLEDIQDVVVLKEGVKHVKRLIETEAMRQTKLRLIDIRMPGQKMAFSDDNLIAYIRHFASTANNPVGTCKMGAINDRTAVVDPYLRVRGIKGLRVIDASIMPHLPSANSSAPTIMIAEKGASFIRKNHSVILAKYQHAANRSSRSKSANGRAVLHE